MEEQSDLKQINIHNIHEENENESPVANDGDNSQITLEF